MPENAVSEPAKDVFQTSFAQQRLWFLEMLEPGTARYNIALAWRLQGSLDVSALERALLEVARRHEILRTTFEPGDDLAVQVVHPAVSWHLQIIQLPEGEAGAQAERQAMRNEASIGFDLANGPLWRASLCRHDPRHHVLLFTLHHIVADGWSVGVLARELGVLYTAFVRGHEPAMLPLPVQYADFAAWQREQLQGERLSQELTHWRDVLAGAPSQLDLPTDRPRPSQPTHRGASHEFDLGPGLSESLRGFCREHRVTPFMALAAALAALLSRWCRQDDLCLGYPVANRQHSQLAGLIGFFVNTLVLRLRPLANQPFLELLRQTRESVLAADAHQDLPFERLVEDINPARSLHSTPLFQVLLSYHQDEHGDDGSSIDLPEVTCQPAASASPVITAKYDLSFALVVRRGRIFGGIEYATDLYDADTIHDLARQYRTLLAGMIDHPQSRICELPLLEEGMKQKLLHEWSGAMQRQEVQEECVHRSIEAQAALAPHALAMVGDFGELSYGELNVRANRLARRLRTLAVGTDVLVGVCAHGGPELVTAMLAVLKAGGAYVPLDPQYPPERLAYMVADAAVPVVLVAPGCGHGLPSTAVQLQVHADDDQEQSGANLDVPVSGGHLAYCIYTSGSTGQPKGAANTHRGFANLVRWYASECLVDAGVAARVLLASSPSFDLTQKNLLGTLAAAGTLVIPAGNARDVDALRQALHQHAPTVINCAPSAYRAYVDEPGTLRTVVLGGEPIDAALAEQVRAHGLRLVNSYGPTECADVAVRHLVADEAAEVPLGRPLANVQVYVLDERCQPVPIGVVGELHIAGAGISRGYVGRAALTAEKFIPDPFGSPGSRMYRTGDLARFRRDGLLEFLGRTDHQVKVRGYRIELGEVESALLRCAGVREAAVLAPADEHGQRSLAAYVSAAEGVGLEPGALRDALASMLPLHMVPTRWQVLPALPLNGSGKIDRLMLAQVHTAAPSGAAYEPPVGATEVLLAGLWADVLRVERVGRHDDFFALGGHSLSATQVVARVNQHLSLRSSVRQLFDASTVSAFARVLDALPVVPVDDSKSSQAIIARPRRAQIQSHGRLASGPPLIYKGRQHE